MTPQEMLAKLKIMTGKTDETMLSIYLDQAAAAIIEKAYPFRNDVTEVPGKYQMRQLEITTYLVGKVGAEGQTVHNENGINRSYESGSIPRSMLRGITPEAKVPIVLIDTVNINIGGQSDENP